MKSRRFWEVAFVTIASAIVAWVVWTHSATPTGRCTRTEKVRTFIMAGKVMVPIEQTMCVKRTQQQGT